MIKPFLMNILLTLVWVALTGSYNPANFAFGLILSFLILWLMARGKDTRYFLRVPKIIAFMFYYLFQMVKANLQIAFDVVTPHYFMRPGIVGLPLDAETDFEITMLSNMISLTPGTLVVDLSSDRKTMYVHVMYLKSREDFIKTIKAGMEKRLLEILR